MNIDQQRYAAPNFQPRIDPDVSVYPPKALKAAFKDLSEASLKEAFVGGFRVCLHEGRPHIITAYEVARAHVGEDVSFKEPTVKVLSRPEALMRLDPAAFKAALTKLARPAKGQQG